MPRSADDQTMTIGEFARRSRLSMKALRLYERIGLLQPADVSADNGYRRYRASQLYQARLIVMLRRLNMPLAEIRRVVGAPGPDAAGVVDAYWDEIERWVAKQRRVVAALSPSLAASGSLDGLSFRLRETPLQTVLTEQRHIYVDELHWIRAATARLTRSARDVGGATGERFVIFHGEVNSDSDGPVEVCVPVASAPPSLASRLEPAHREAYTAITKAQFEMPMIMSVYDALDEWIASEGLRRVGSPREVYRDGVDLDAAAPDDEICDVAAPVV